MVSGGLDDPAVFAVVARERRFRPFRPDNDVPSSIPCHNERGHDANEGATSAPVGFTRVPAEPRISTPAQAALSHQKFRLRRSPEIPKSLDDEWV